jgi:hypothetical protein
MKVKNINGTAANKCNCGSWLAHWKNHTTQTANYCSEAACRNPPTVGGHVQKDSSTDRSWYIVPLCDSHNKQAETLEIMDSRVLVPANKAETCGK